MSTLEKIINAEKEAKTKLAEATAKVSQISKDTDSGILALETHNHEKRQSETKKINESTNKKLEQITAAYLVKRAEIKKELAAQVSAKEQVLVNKIVKGLVK